MSIKEDLVEVLMKNKMMEWIVKLIERSTSKEIHTFSLDFGSALLANILHANSTLEYLEKNPAMAKSVRISYISYKNIGARKIAGFN
jgi:hypothetical protein